MMDNSNLPSIFGTDRVSVTYQNEVTPYNTSSKRKMEKRGMNDQIKLTNVVRTFDSIVITLYHQVNGNWEVLSFASIFGFGRK